MLGHQGLEGYGARRHLNEPTMADMAGLAGARLPPPRCCAARREPPPQAPQRRSASWIPSVPAGDSGVCRAAGVDRLAGRSVADARVACFGHRETHRPPGRAAGAGPEGGSDAAGSPPAQSPAQAPGTEPAPQDAKPSPVRRRRRRRIPSPVRWDLSPRPSRPPAAQPAKPAVRTAGHAGRGRDQQPGGATASLDGNTAVTCSTPCSLSAAPGRHTLSLSLPGYQMERHDILVATSTLELAPVVMKASGGTLMLSSDPAGAAISINGKQIDAGHSGAALPRPGGPIRHDRERRAAGHREGRDQSGINQRKIILGQWSSSRCFSPMAAQSKLRTATP